MTKDPLKWSWDKDPKRTPFNTKKNTKRFHKTLKCFYSYLLTFGVLILKQKALEFTHAYVVKKV